MLIANSRPLWSWNLLWRLHNTDCHGFALALSGLGLLTFFLSTPLVVVRVHKHPLLVSNLFFKSLFLFFPFNWNKTLRHPPSVPWLWFEYYTHTSQRGGDTTGYIVFFFVFTTIIWSLSSTADFYKEAKMADFDGNPFADPEGINPFAVSSYIAS